MMTAQSTGLQSLHLPTGLCFYCLPVVTPCRAVNTLDEAFSALACQTWLDAAALRVDSKNWEGARQGSGLDLVARRLPPEGRPRFTPVWWEARLVAFAHSECALPCEIYDQQ
jgi:hypothetical protein